MEVQTTARNASLNDLVEMLREQSDVRYDAVVPASELRSHNGHIALRGGAARITDEGVERAWAYLAPTDVFDDGVSQRLAIPRDYLRRMRGRDDNGALVDANVNAWLDEQGDKRYLVRGFRTDDPDALGIARALLSDRFRPIDNLDVLLAVLDGVRKSGVEAHVDGGDLTERKMRLRLSAPSVQALAPVLLRDYVSPFTRQRGADLPVVFGGFEVRNSETGGAAFQIVPRLTVEVCKNGMTITKDAMREVHLGGRLDEGVVRWSEETLRHNIDLVTSQARDAVSTFLDPAYVARAVEQIEQKSATPIEGGATVEVIENVGKTFKFTEAEQASILDCFIESGDRTAGGVMQAVTAAAQHVDNPDRAADLEDAALDVLAHVAG